MAASRSKRPRKTGKKTGGAKIVVSPRNGAQMEAGAHPGNTGGKKGRSGRRSQKLGLFLKELRESPDAQEALMKAAVDSTNRNFGNAWKLAADYDDEKPAQRISIDTARLDAMSDEELAAVAAGKTR